MSQRFRRIYAIPDVHGRLDLLDLALERLDADGYDAKQDLLIFLGDMIDRGPDSKDVLDLIIKLEKDNPDTVKVLRGNHENLAIDARLKNRPHGLEAWYWNGGRETDLSYPDRKISDEHLKYINSLPYSFEAQGFFFSHAPVPREKARTGKTEHGLMDYEFGSKGTGYNVWELTWHYFGRESEKPGGMMHVHEGPLSNAGIGSDHLIGVCGHIHRGSDTKEIRTFPKYRLLDCGSGCFPSGSLAIHECISNRTLYARPDPLNLIED